VRVKLLQNTEIDFSKWDNCIKNSFKGNIFALSWYLDISSPNWQAMVIGDYESVLPLLVKKKLRFELIYKPQFSGRLGIFSNDLLSPKAEMLFWRDIQLSYLATRINLNFFSTKPSFEEYTVTPIKSFLLDSATSYKNIQANFKEDQKTILATAKKDKVFFINSLMVGKLLSLAKNEKQYTEEELAKVQLICTATMRRNKGRIFGAYDSDNSLGATVLVAGSHQTRDLLFATAVKGEKGKILLSALLNHILLLNANKNITFVIGPDSGALNQEFADNFGFSHSFTNEVSYNRLPWYAKGVRF